MKKLVIGLLVCTYMYGVEPEISAKTQVKEQVQHIEIPSHIKGLRIVNNNTLSTRLDDRVLPLPAPYQQHDYYPASRIRHQAAVVEGIVPARWQRTLISGLVIGTTYLVARAYFFLLAKELDKKSHWWHWKSELSLPALTQVPEKELAHELSVEIQQRYSKKTVRDVAFIMPLVHFIQDTNYEQEYLEHLIGLYKKVETWGMQTLFAVDPEVLDNARVKLTRLNVMRQLYMKWLSGYAVDVPAVS